jgi:hypothetical protein
MLERGFGYEKAAGCQRPKLSLEISSGEKAEFTLSVIP